MVSQTWILEGLQDIHWSIILFVALVVKESVYQCSAVIEISFKDILTEGILSLEEFISSSMLK